MKLIILGCGLLSALTGCMSGLDRTASGHMNSLEYQNRPAATPSLFATDEAVLSGTSIEQILNSKVVIPKKARLAVLQFGERQPWMWWSEDLAQLNQDLEKGTIGKLRSCARLTDVSLLPALMSPDKKTIPYLREAAARYQAELLLVYRSGSRSYDKYKFLGPEEVKSKCVVEAILLDVRTGIVPFSSVSAQEYTAKRSKQDYGYSETVAKAELKATTMGLEKIAGDLVQFLETTP